LKTIGLSPLDIADFGKVILLKHIVPFSPVTVKDTAIDVADSFLTIVRLENWI
jgi:hypothetical protein